jgi:hypothetical protein
MIQLANIAELNHKLANLIYVEIFGQIARDKASDK